MRGRAKVSALRHGRARQHTAAIVSKIVWGIAAKKSQCSSCGQLHAGMGLERRGIKLQAIIHATLLSDAKSDRGDGNQVRMDAV